MQSKKRSSLTLGMGTLFILIAATVARAEVDPVATTQRALHGAVLTAAEVTNPRIEQLKTAGTTAIVVVLEGTSEKLRQQQHLAATRIRQADLDLYYWIEVARCPELADVHPQWMASLQGHPEWRRFFPDAPIPADDEVVKTYPWVPILSRETYAAQLTRVRQQLAGLPEAQGVLLNDLQGAPSACGCGHPLCRWTSDYGKKRSTTPLKDDAAAMFVQAVQQFVPQTSVIPVWTTECEKHDGVKDGLCAGVGCFQGICWKASTAQLMPLQNHAPQLAVLLPFREFQRDLPIYGPKAGWIRHAIESFVTMPPRDGGQPVQASRLIAVLQGWNVDEADVATQIQMATESGAAGYLVAYAKIEQRWEPKIVKWRQPG